MKTVTVKDYYEYEALSKKYTGIVKWLDSDKDTWHVVNHKLHRELGPAIHGGIDNQEVYYLNGLGIHPKDYWEIMLKKYRGTEHEALCLAGLLGKEE